MELMLLKLVIVAVVIERAVAQLKAIVKTDLKARPWPLLSLVISGLLVATYSLDIFPDLLGHEVTQGPAFIGAFLGWAVTTLTLAGGSAGVIDLAKSIKRAQKEVKGA